MNILHFTHILNSYILFYDVQVTVHRDKFL